jgi:hypothetical protein
LLRIADDVFFDDAMSDNAISSALFSDAFRTTLVALLWLVELLWCVCCMGTVSD